MSRDYETDEELQQSLKESMSEDDEESSQSSDQSSAEEDEGNEIKEHKVKPQPWKRIIHKAMDRHRDQLERLTNEYKHNGESEEIAAQYYASCVQKRGKKSFVRIFNMNV